jgi:hypothetical protein
MNKLIGKQSKLDRNKNGKLDSQDFKMLRSGKKGSRKDEQFVDRVINILVERRLDELSQKTYNSAFIKARNIAGLEHGREGQHRKVQADKFAKKADPKLTRNYETGGSEAPTGSELTDLRQKRYGDKRNPTPNYDGRPILPRIRRVGR